MLYLVIIIQYPIFAYEYLGVLLSQNHYFDTAKYGERYVNIATITQGFTARRILAST